MKKLVQAFEKNLDKIINITIVLLIIYIAFYIFIGSYSLMNSDSTFILDYALEQIRTHSIFPKGWVNTNDFWVYSLIPIITPLLKFGISLFKARQISVFIQTILLFLILYDLFKNQLEDKKGLKIIFLLFLSGISGQFMFEVFGDATYGSIIFYMILCLWLYIKYEKQNKKRYLIFFGLIMTFITICSLRFPIYIGAPIICCLLYFIYEKGLEKKHINIFITLIVSIMIGFVGYKVLCHIYILDNTHIPNVTIGTSKELQTSVFDTIFDYLTMCGSTYVNTNSLGVRLRNYGLYVSSPFIVFVFIRYIYAICTIALPFVLFKKIKKMNNIEKILYIYTTSLTFIIFFFLVIGRMSYWYRYITPVFFFLNLLYPLLYKYYFEKKKKDRIVFILIFILFLSTSLIFSISSFYDVKRMKLRKNAHQDLVDLLVKNDLKVGFEYPENEQSLYFLLSKGQIRMLTISGESTPYFWLNSVDWYKKSYFKGNAFFIRKEKHKPLSYEKEATKVLKYKDYRIFIFDDIKTITGKFKKTDVKGWDPDE